MLHDWIMLIDNLVFQSLPHWSLHTQLLDTVGITNLYLALEQVIL